MNSVWLGVVLSAILGAHVVHPEGWGIRPLPRPHRHHVVGLYIATAFRFFLRLAIASCQRSAALGKWSHIVGWISILWIAFITVLFLAPPFWPFWPLGKKIRNDDGSVALYSSTTSTAPAPDRPRVHRVRRLVLDLGP